MTYFETPEDALQHYGVKGMRWGVRKDRSQADIQRSAARRKTAKKVVRSTVKLAAGVAISAAILEAHGYDTRAMARSAGRTASKAAKEVTSRGSKVVPQSRTAARGASKAKDIFGDVPKSVWDGQPSAESLKKATSMWNDMFGAPGDSPRAQQASRTATRGAKRVIAGFSQSDWNASVKSLSDDISDATSRVNDSIRRQEYHMNTAYPRLKPRAIGGR